MKKLGLLLTATALFAFIGCKEENKKVDIDLTDDTVEMDNTIDADKDAPKTISVMMEPKSDSNVKGEAYFTQKDGKVRMEAKFSGLTPGSHAIHLHEKADCSSADGTSTGGHWNPTHERHGKWGDAEGYHKGDIGNFDADADGNGGITFETDEWCIGCGDENKDILGKAVIVHQGTDDFVSQPTGDAGGRVSCGGVIE
jgi:Cu-Zn family superoxide dismutase